MIKLLIIPLLVLVNAQPVWAQNRAGRDSTWPDAETVLQQLLDGERSVAISRAIRACPAHNPYGDSIWSALLAMHPTPDLVRRLGPAWSDAITTCGDPRLDEWYRARALEVEDIPSANLILPALLGHQTAENVALLKRIAYDDTREEMLRLYVLRGLANGQSPQARVGLYLEAISRSDVPEEYRYQEAHALLRSPAADVFVARGLGSIRGHPGRSGAHQLLITLAHDSEVARVPARRGQVAAVVNEILGSPAGSYPPGLVTAARVAAGALESVRQNGRS